MIRRTILFLTVALVAACANTGPGKAPAPAEAAVAAGETASSGSAATCGWPSSTAELPGPELNVTARTTAPMAAMAATAHSSLRLPGAPPGVEATSTMASLCGAGVASSSSGSTSSV
ncbi:MAG: hypothetical protein ABFS86_09410, partial [Planctomycetota bacterium]